MITFKQCMKRKRMRQVELSKLIGWNLCELNKFVNGWGKIPTKHKQKFCEKLNLSNEEFEAMTENGFART